MWEKYWHLCRDFARRKEGAIVILVALALPIAIGFAGLATDVGIWYNQKRQLQTAADAGALGGAYALSTTGVSTIVPYATTDAKRNAYNPSLGPITVNYPPASGPYAGNMGAVEVILEQVATLYFAKMFLSDPPIIHVRAVALTQGLNADLCILTLGGSGLWTQGTGDIVAPKCTLYSDTTLGTKGNSTITALAVYAHTTISGSITTTQGQHPNSPIVPDPLSGLPLPTYSGCSQTNFSSKTTQTINPGVYCGGMKLNAKANVTMNPGVYIINGGSLDINGQAELTGSGVTFVLTSSTGNDYPSVTINGGADVNLSAPTSGTYAGILFYSDRRAPAMTQKFNGGSNNAFEGILYFPTQSLEFSGNSSSQSCGRSSSRSCLRTISLDLTVTGNSYFGTNCSSTFKVSVPGGVSLVE
ncbi:MAG: hypothetical protein C0514_06845 [Candidatus Puniceispirillum sp.]|nr:hypothetical protein [Candidatus Puniceispirillum sp.]